MIKTNCPKVAKNLFILLIVSLVFAVSISTSAYALTSENINFQGKIVRNDTGHEGLNVIPGTPACVVDGAGNDTCDFQVAYYTAATAGTLLLTETFSNVEIGQYDGVFELSLGSGSMTTTVQCRDGTCNTPMEVISEYTDLYVELKFAPDGTNLTETFTRMPLEASAYSIFSKYAEGAHDAFKLSTSLSTPTQSSPTTGMIYYNTTDSKVQLYNGTSWENISGESLWTDAGTFTYLTSATDDLVLGATTVSDSTFFFDMDASSGSYFEIDDASNTNRLFTILSGGNVGIGTATPGAKLEVAGASSTITNASGDLTISTGGLNGNILLSPHGTGSVRANSPLGIRETGTTPTFYTYLQGGDQAADITYTLPTSSSTGLLKNTAGVLSWDTNTYITGVNWSQVSNGTGIYMDYKPNDTACTGNQVLKYSVGTGWICADDSTGSATAWDDISDPDASSTIVHGAFSTDMQFDSFTSGSAFKISSTATGLTGSLLDVSLSGSNAANTGSLLTLNNTGTLNTGTTLLINHYATGTGNLAFRVNDVSGDTTPFVIDGGGNVGIGISNPDVSLEIIAPTLASYDTAFEVRNWVRFRQDSSSGPKPTVDIYSSGSWYSSFQFGSAQNESYGNLRIRDEGEGLILGSNTAGYIHKISTSSETISLKADRVNSGPTWARTIYTINTSDLTPTSRLFTINVPLKIQEVSGQSADLFNIVNTSSNSLFYVNNTGNVGIGTPSPTAYLHLKAGTASANTAPLKFTTGVNLTTAESGAMEWDGSRLYMTNTTPTRNTIAYTSDIPTSDNYQYWTARADSGTDQNVTSGYILDFEGSEGIDSAIVANKITIGTTGVLEDLNTLGAATAADQFIVSTAAGVFAYESGSTVRTSLGATTVGSNLFTLTNPSAITFLRVNADNTVSALNASDFRTAIGAGTGSGTVTSVATGTGLTGGTITTTGTISLDYSNTLASNSLALNNTVFGSTGVLFEGATSDTFETLLTLTDPTADNTITLQNNSGIVPLGTAANTLFFTTTGATNVTLPTSGTLATTTQLGALSWADIDNGTGVYIDYKPNNSACTGGQVLKYTVGTGWLCGDDNAGTGGDDWGTQTVVSDIALTGVGTSASPLDFSYTSTLAGNPTMGAGEALFGTTGIIFEGATADTYEGLLTLTDPTADNTWTLQNNSGLIPLSTLANTLFFTTTGATNVTLPTSGTLATTSQIPTTYWSKTGTEVYPTTSGDSVRPNGTATLGTSANRWSTIYGVDADLTSSATTTNILNVVGNSLTTGTLTNFSSSSTGLTTGGLLNISATGAPAASWTGDLVKMEYNNADADVDGSALKVGLLGTTALGSGTALNITTSQTGTGALALRVNDDGTYTDSTPFVIDTSGNVGIGTTSSTNAKLEISYMQSTSILPGLRLVPTGVAGINTASYLGGGYMPGGSIMAVSEIDSSTVPYALYYGSGSGIATRLDLWRNTHVAFASTDIYFNMGDVGIGTTSPDYALQVNGTIAPESHGQDLGVSGYGNRWDIFGNIGDFTNYIDSTANLFNIEGFSLTSGIALKVSSTSGSTSDTVAQIGLDNASGAASGSVLKLTNSYTSNTGTTLLVNHYATGSGNLALRINDVSGDTTPFVIDGAGNVGIGTSSPSTLLQLGTTGALAGTLSLAGVTSGLVTIDTLAAAGTWALTLPDSDGDSGQVLTTDGSGNTSWTTVATDSTAWDEILDPTTSSSIAHGAFSTEFTFDSIAAGSGLKLSSGSVLGTASSSSTVLEIARSGANTNTAHTAYGVYSTVTNTNATSGTNIAGYFSASGATTANYGLIVNAGNVGIGSTTPSNKFVVNTSAYSTIELQYGGTSVVDIFSNASSNIFIGLDSGSAIYTGTGNIALGDNALSANTTGSSNTALGHYALDTNVAKQGSTAVGYQAMMFADSTATAGLSYNTAIGYQALTGSGTAANNTGTANTAVGHQSLTGNTSGSYNIALGVNTLNANTTGTQNVAIGYNSLFTNVAKQGSVAIGYEAMRYADSTATGALTYNTAIGYQALHGSTTAANNTGTSNSAIGNKAMFSNTSGSKNVVLGDSALYTNTTGSNNLALGYKALYSSTGGNNIAIGYQANDLTSFTGTNNIIIGYDIDMPATTSSNMLNIGNLIFATGLDGTGQTLSNGKVGIGTTLPTSMFSVGLSSQFQVDSSGDLVKIKNVTYAWPSSNASGALVNNGSGTLSWTAMVTGSGTGSATAGQATFWNGTKSITGDDAFWWDNTNKRLGLGTTTPAATLDIGGSSSSIANSSGDITIDAAEDLIIDSKVGIGTSGTFDPKLAVIGLGATSATTNTELLNSSSTSLFKVLDDGKISFSANVEFSKDGTNWVPMGATTKTVLLAAEYPGAVLSADGTANIGSMTSDSESSTANAMNYYEWSSSETSLNDYDVRVRFQLPSDFDGWGSGGVQFYYATESTSAASNKADFYIYEQSSGTADGSSTAQVSSTAGTWTSTTIAGSGLTLCVDSGDVCVFVIRQYSTSDNYVRVGDINITYDRKL